MDNQQQGIIKNYVQSYNNFDIEGMTKDLDEGIVFQHIAHGEVNVKTEGLQAFREQAESAKQYFKEREQTITSWEMHDSVVTIEISYKAILAIDLPNGLVAGDTLELKGTSSFEFENGKITRITDKS